MRITLSLLLVANVGGLAACGSGDDGERGVSILTHDSFLVTPEVWEHFTAETGIDIVDPIGGGDAGIMVNQAVLTKDAPVADVLFGIDNTLLSLGLSEDLFVPYESPELVNVPEEFQLDPEHRVTPIDFGDVCVNFDIEALDDLNLEPPATIDELTEPRFKDLLVVPDAAASSPGLAFLLATIARFGEEAEGEGEDDYSWKDYWAELRANGLIVAPDWTASYFEHFTAGSETGDRPLVVSYASSPPASVSLLDPLPSVAPIQALLDGCYRQIEFVGILRGTEREDEARQLIDFMLSTRFQEDMPLNMFVFPVHERAELPEAFNRFAQVPTEPLKLDPELIAENRERWIQEWRDVVFG